MWTNWRLSAKDKPHTEVPQRLSTMEVRSLVNPTTWNWLWDDRDVVTNYIGGYIRVRDGTEIFNEEDTIDIL